jgi:hypothetical protein
LAVIVASLASSRDAWPIVIPPLLGTPAALEQRCSTWIDSWFEAESNTLLLICEPSSPMTSARPPPDTRSASRLRHRTNLQSPLESASDAADCHRNCPAGYTYGRDPDMLAVSTLGGMMSLFLIVIVVLTAWGVGAAEGTASTYLAGAVLGVVGALVLLAVMGFISARRHPTERDQTLRPY